MVTKQPEQALAVLPIVEQAIGLLRGRTGGTETEAFDRLGAISQVDHRKVGEVAQLQTATERHLLNDRKGSHLYLVTRAGPSDSAPAST